MKAVWSWVISWYLNFGLILLGAAAFPFFLSGCLNGSNCSCTLKGCMEGIAIEIKKEGQSEEYLRALRIEAVYGDTSEVAKYYYGSDSLHRFLIESPRLRRERPQQVSLTMVSGADTLKRVPEAKLDWESFVCNECSGKYVDCPDDMAHIARLAL